jgi:antibiotic biosynthesis monooxygenase (ABM) superfamily enzyme
LAVLQVTRYDVPGDKLEAYSKWAEGAIKRILAVPGVVEFRAYRPTVGTSLVVQTYEFADLAAWAAWRSNKETEKLVGELETFVVNMSNEVWGPSPIVPKPIRP